MWWNAWNTFTSAPRSTARWTTLSDRFPAGCLRSAVDLNGLNSPGHDKATDRKVWTQSPSKEPQGPDDGTTNSSPKLGCLPLVDAIDRQEVSILSTSCTKTNVERARWIANAAALLVLLCLGGVRRARAELGCIGTSCGSWTANVLPTPADPLAQRRPTAPSRTTRVHPYAGRIRLFEYEQRSCSSSTSSRHGNMSATATLTRTSCVRSTGFDHPLAHLEIAQPLAPV